MWKNYNPFGQLAPANNKMLGLQISLHFLRERFWVCDQLVSSDETGVDCTIQRKIALTNLMDTTPAHFGIVKSLYYVSESTEHLISKEHVFDEENQPRKEFFVLAHTGSEKNHKTWFLSAEKIIEAFPVVIIGGVEKFALTGSIVLNDKYLVSSRENTLAKMEYALMETDFIKNRQFFLQRSPDWTTVIPDQRYLRDEIAKHLTLVMRSLKNTNWQMDAQHKGMSQHFTNSLLKDRFWIPEKALVFQEAIYDFIIQRKVTPQNFPDNAPPIFGLVKCWFFESEAATYYIPKTSVIDEENKPRKDFFFIAYSEKNQTRRTYFLTAKLVAENFDLAFINGAEKFCIPGSALITSDRYLVTSKDNMLAKIEYQLFEADFLKNRLLFATSLHSNN